MAHLLLRSPPSDATDRDGSAIGTCFSTRPTPARGPAQSVTPAFLARTPTLPARTPALPARTPALPARTPTLPARTPTLPARTPALPARTPALLARSPASTRASARPAPACRPGRAVMPRFGTESARSPPQWRPSATGHLQRDRGTAPRRRTHQKAGSGRPGALAHRGESEPAGARAVDVEAATVVGDRHGEP